MPCRFLTVLTMAALFGWPACGRAEDQSAGASVQTGAISGQVVDLQGRPVAGATVWGVAYQEKAGPVRSGADGRFRLAGLKLGKPVTVWADAPEPGARASRRRPHLPRARTTTSAGSRSYPAPGSSAASSTRRANRSPEAGVKLELYRHQLGHTISSQGTEWTLNAGDDGRFATPPLPAGDAHFYLERTPARSAPSSRRKPSRERPSSTLAMSRSRTRYRSSASSSTGRASRHPESRSSPITTGENAAKDRQGRPVHRPRRRQGPQESAASSRTTTSAPKPIRRRPRPDGPEAHGDQGLRDPRDGGRRRDG